MKRLKKILLLTIVIITLILFLQSLGFLTRKMIIDAIIQVREWVTPYSYTILKIFFMTFLVSIILVYFDKDFDEDQIKRNLKTKFISIYFPSNSTIKTQPFAGYLFGLSVVILLIVFFLLFTPDIFQVEAPSLREIFDNYKMNKED